MKGLYVHRLEAVRALACVGWIALGLVAGRAPSHAQTYTITDLSTGQGNDSITPYGLNSLGEAVGESQTASPISGALFSNGTITLIEPGSVAYGINASGEIVGEVAPGEGAPPESSGNFDAFIYSNGTITDINSRSLFPYGSQAAAVNISGQVVGTGYPVATQSPPFHAFLYNGGKMTDINPPGAYSSFGVAINDSGQIIVSWSPTTGTGGGVSLYSNGKFVALPDGTNVGANAINNAGQVAGSISSSAGTHAAVYSGGVWTDLGTITGAVAAEATGINASGQVVGIAIFPDTGKYPHRIPGKQVAFTVRNGAPVDLNTLIAANSGYTIEAAGAAVCINASGQILCSAKTPAGYLHAVLLTPN